eukprot:1158715-Pelagomonas_calceolata.AAC.8
MQESIYKGRDCMCSWSQRPASCCNGPDLPLQPLPCLSPHSSLLVRTTLLHFACRTREPVNQQPDSPKPVPACVAQCHKFQPATWQCIAVCLVSAYLYEQGASNPSALHPISSAKAVYQLQLATPHHPLCLAHCACELSQQPPHFPHHHPGCVSLCHGAPAGHSTSPSLPCPLRVRRISNHPRTPFITPIVSHLVVVLQLSTPHHILCLAHRARELDQRLEGDLLDDSPLWTNFHRAAVVGLRTARQGSIGSRRLLQS